MSECKLLCVSVPEELKCFCKKSPEIMNFISKCPTPKNFGVKLFKAKDGRLEYAAYYSDYGEILKKVYYKGSSVVYIEHFRMENLFYSENFEEDQLIKKCFYNKEQKIISEILYEYNRQKNITCITKNNKTNTYKVEYGYDELNRVDSRILYYDNKVVNKQKYKFDILDRIVEYSDLNQKVNVLKVSPSNELINYIITDTMDNEIIVFNWFDTKGYSRTDVTLNGHKISIVDRSYVDNVMLKKPYTTEDDLDLIISRIFNDTQQECVTKRSSSLDVSNEFIENSIQARVLPISIRKRIFYNMSLNVY